MYSQPLKIFYADDDEDDHLLFEEAIKDVTVPLELTLFDDGIALEEKLMLNNYNCDLVFLDLNMPAKGGIEVLKSLQPAIIEKSLKVIIFSTSDEPQAIQKAFELRASLFVKKPISFTMLEFILKTIIEKGIYHTVATNLETFYFK